MRETDNVIRAFSEEDVVRLTGVSSRQLRYWDRTKFVTPSLADENRRRPHSRIYSFRDVACLRVLNALRNEARVSLQHLREVKEKLYHLGDDMWAKTTLYVLSRRVILHNPQTEQREDVLSQQAILQIPLRVVTQDIEQTLSALWERDEATIGQIERKRGVASNEPVIAGTRIPVRAIKAFSEAGYSVNQILQEYPTLTSEDIQAALRGDKAA